LNFEKFWKLAGCITSILTVAIVLAAFPLNARLDRVEDAHNAHMKQTDVHIKYIREDVAELKVQMESLSSGVDTKLEAVQKDVSGMETKFNDFKIDVIREIQKLLK